MYTPIYPTTVQRVHGEYIQQLIIQELNALILINYGRSWCPPTLSVEYLWLNIALSNKSPTPNACFSAFFMNEASHTKTSRLVHRTCDTLNLYTYIPYYCSKGAGGIYSTTYYSGTYALILIIYERSCCPPTLLVEYLWLNIAFSDTSVESHWTYQSKDDSTYVSYM